jgi:hypothetical protein
MVWEGAQSICEKISIVCKIELVDNKKKEIGLKVIWQNQQFDVQG